LRPAAEFFAVSGLILETKFLGRAAMTTIVDRRGMVRIALGGAAAAAFGLALLPEEAESAPLTVGAGQGITAENPIEKAVVVARRRRIRRCWWRGGRRRCRWVWVR
jgi:hypothetical protein